MTSIGVEKYQRNNLVFLGSLQHNIKVTIESRIRKHDTSLELKTQQSILKRADGLLHHQAPFSNHHPWPPI
jgi:hypothetical protein